MYIPHGFLTVFLPYEYKEEQNPGDYAKPVHSAIHELLLVLLRVSLSRGRERHRCHDDLPFHARCRKYSRKGVNYLMVICVARRLIVKRFVSVCYDSLELSIVSVRPWRSERWPENTIISSSYSSSGTVVSGL